DDRGAARERGRGEGARDRVRRSRVVRRSVDVRRRRSSAGGGALLLPGRRVSLPHAPRAEPDGAVPVAAQQRRAAVKPAPLEYLRAKSPAEAVSLLERYDGTARLLAGGQSLVPLLSMRLVRPAAVIDVNPITGLDGVEAHQSAGAVTIGALARYSALERS